jgi:RNA polymerase sigma-70 factor (ECF subfamily)
VKFGYSDLDDRDLVIACQKNIVGAFDALYRRYKAYVHRMLHRLVPNMTQDHDDLVQMVFIRVWKCIHTLRNPAVFKTWLSQVATHIAYDEIRKQPKSFVVSLDQSIYGADGEDDKGGCHEIADSRAQPDECCEQSELIAQINHALELLPKRFKKMIVLREVYGLSYDEIALRTDTGLGTVKSRIARAKGKMQSHMEKVRCA